MDIKNFAERLKSLRGNKTQSQVATEMNKTLSSITQQTLGRYENGERLPNAEMLCDIADYYGVSVDYLLGRADKETGLKGNAIKALKELNNKHDSRAYIDLLSILLEDTNLEYLLGLLEAYITSDDKKLAFTPEAAMSVVQNGEKAVIKLAIIDEVEHLLDRIKPIFLNNAIPTEVKLINLLYKKGAISEKERIRQIDDFYRRFYHGEHQGKQE